MERGDETAQKQWLQKAIERFKKTLTIDAENVAAHYNLALIYDRLGDSAQAAHHRKLHERYRPDDNARDRAISIHRRQNPAADHAAQATVIYSLQRPGAPGLTAGKATPDNRLEAKNALAGSAGPADP